MKKTSVLVVSAAVLSLTACVSSSKHEQAVKDYEAKLEAANNDKKKLADLATELETRLTSTEQKLITTAKDRGQLRTSLADIQKSMDEMRERQKEQRERLQEFQDLTRRFKKLTDAGTLSVKIVDGKMVVSLGSDVLFPSGSAKLSQAGVDAIKEVSLQLASIPGKRYQVEGHTDNVPIATAVFPSNWELASARALSVVRTMIDSGMPGDRVSAASYGEFQPVHANDSTEGKAANRRIAIVIVPDLSSLPGYDELQKLSN